MMRDIYYYEIRKRIKEIRNLEQSTASEEVLSPSATESTANKNMLVDTVEKLVWLSLLARREGLLALESAAYEMEGFPGVKYLKIMVLLVCDETFPEDLEESLFFRTTQRLRGIAVSAHDVWHNGNAGRKESQTD